MTLKLLIFLTTCVFLVHGSDVDRRGTNDAESYITKEAAKELRSKLSNTKDAIEQQDDYDEILKDIIKNMRSREKPKQQKQIFYEKKYFDYLPNDIFSDSDDVTSEDLSHELVKSLSEYISSEEHKPSDQQKQMNNNDETRRENSRKMKRDVSMQQDDKTNNNNNDRSKRQSIIYVPLVHYNPHPNTHFYYPPNDPFFHEFFPIASESRSDFRHSPISSLTYQVPQQQHQQFGINPWTPQNNPNMKFHSPYNFYLPPSNQYLPAQPTNRPPVNVPFPPDNKPGVTNDDTIIDRIAGFEEDDKPIWNIENLQPSQPAPQRPHGQFPPPPPRAPPPSATKRPPYSPPTNSIDDSGIFSPDQRPTDIEIEYAPELQEDATTTTRRSIQIPTRRNQNKNRQKKEEITTESTTTITNTLYTQQDFAKVQNSRKPNKPLPACVEAIVNCCSKYDDKVRLPCFEAHNCNGAFFGRSPCSNDIKQAAFKEVEKYSDAKK